MPRPSFRRAIAASVLVHAALAGALLWGLRSPVPVSAPLDTDVAADVKLTLCFAPEPVAEIIAPPTPQPAAAPVSSPHALARPTPRTLPTEVLQLLQQPKRPSPAAEPVGSDVVVEVPITPTAVAPPSAASRTIVPASALATATPAMHGLLPERSIVYVLDASGSMGEWGKFARARLTLLATLRQQPSTTRFQIVVYNSTARVLVPSNGGCLPVSEASTRQAEAELAKVAPVGKSEHLRGFQTALNLRSDYIVIVTDADDLPAAKLRAAISQAARPVVVCVAKVTADGVGVPREWK